MTLSEFISYLKAIQNEHGNIEISYIDFSEEPRKVSVKAYGDPDQQFTDVSIT